MKKVIYLSLVILSTVILTGCKSSEKTLKLQPYKAKDYISKEIKIYEVKEWLYPTLDSIIIETKEYLEDKKFKDQAVFTFNIIGELSSLGKFADFSVEGFYSSESINHAVVTEAIFYYKGYSFYCGKIFLDLFFNKTNKTISLTCIDPKKFRYETYLENTIGAWLYMQDLE